MSVVSGTSTWSLFSAGNAVLLFNARPGVSNHEIYGLILLHKIRVIHRSSVCALRGTRFTSQA